MFILLFSGCIENQEKNNEKNQENDIPNETPEPSDNPSTIFVGKSAKSNFTHIQDALDFASDNDIILVEPGIYQEILQINKSISLIGENQNNTFLSSKNETEIEIIDGIEVIKEKYNIQIITINADFCNIKNFSFVKNHTNNLINGITMNFGNNSIMNCNISGFYNAIQINRDSDNNIISQNMLSNNLNGIEAKYSENNLVTNNYLYNNNQHGVYFNSFSNQNIFSKNIFINNNKALRIKSSENNQIFNNYFYNNTYGLYICCGAEDNRAFNNTLIKNNKSNGFEDYKLWNHWNADGIAYGNYWDDYTGFDNDGNGIGDSYYTIQNSGNNDYFPLMNPVDVDYYFKNKITE